MSSFIVYSRMLQYFDNDYMHEKWVGLDGVELFAFVLLYNLIDDTYSRHQKQLPMNSPFDMVPFLVNGARTEVERERRFHGTGSLMGSF